MYRFLAIFLPQILETLQAYLKEKKLIELWLPTCQKLAKIFLQSQEYQKFKEILREIKECETYGQINLRDVKDLKGIGLFAEIAALEIQYYLDVGDIAGLRSVNESLVKNKVSEICDSDPKILGALKEAEARIYLL